MMRSMRAIVKPVFYVLAISFVAWLALGQVTDILGGGKDVVLKVEGEVVRSQPFQLQYQAALEQYRRQQGGARLSREDEQQVQNQVADQFIHNILLERAYRRLGITVSDAEIIQAARSGPPPRRHPQQRLEPAGRRVAQLRRAAARPGRPGQRGRARPRARPAGGDYRRQGEVRGRGEEGVGGLGERGPRRRPGLDQAQPTGLRPPLRRGAPFAAGRRRERASAVELWISPDPHRCGEGRLRPRAAYSRRDRPPGTASRCDRRAH